jgi:hypothetical protein
VKARMRALGILGPCLARRKSGGPSRLTVNKTAALQN